MYIDFLFCEDQRTGRGGNTYNKAKNKKLIYMYTCIYIYICIYAYNIIYMLLKEKYTHIFSNLFRYMCIGTLPNHVAVHKSWDVKDKRRAAIYLSLRAMRRAHHRP